MHTPSQDDIMYTTGLFDGEGCVVAFITNGVPQRRLNITMACEPIIDWLVATWGGVKGICNNSTCRRPTWTWNLSGRVGLDFFANHIAPHSKLKGLQLSLVVKLSQLRPGRGIPWDTEKLGQVQALVIEIQRLNQGGVPREGFHY